MKKVFLVLLVASSAFAAPGQPLLTKSSGGGFMAPEYATSERCDVYADKVVVSHYYGRTKETALQVVEEKAVKITGDVGAVIEKAKTETLGSKPNNLCDGPSTSITANPAQGAALPLFSTGGCGSPQRSRDGVYSRRLRTIADLYCPNTYKFGAQQD